MHFYGLYDLLGPVVSYFCRRQGIPYVIEPMGMYRPIDRSIQHETYLASHSSGAAFWRNAAQIIATSELEQQELMKTASHSKKLRFVTMESTAEP